MPPKTSAFKSVDPIERVTEVLYAHSFPMDFIDDWDPDNPWNVDVHVSRKGPIDELLRDLYELHDEGVRVVGYWAGKNRSNARLRMRA